MLDAVVFHVFSGALDAVVIETYCTCVGHSDVLDIVMYGIV